MKVTRINPVAKAMAHSRRRTSVMPNKKKYNRKKENNNANKEQHRGFTISENSDKKENS